MKKNLLKLCTLRMGDHAVPLHIQHRIRRRQNAGMLQYCTTIIALWQGLYMQQSAELLVID